MSYPRNSASPEPVAIGAVVKIDDGSVQTSGVTVRIKPKGVAESNGLGVIAYSTDGVVEYTPTQAETDFTSFILIASKTGCIPASVTVVPSASATPGRSVLSSETHTGAIIPRVTLVDVTTTNTDMLTGAAVNAEVVDVLSVDTFNELATPPAANSSLKDKITWLFMWLRNKSTESATERKLYADDTTTVVSTETMGESAGVFTKGEQV